MSGTIAAFYDVFIDFIHNTSTNWTMKETHFHNHYEINLSISGGNRFIVNEKIYDAKPGSLFILSDKDLHRNIVPRGFNYERYMVSFSPDALPDFASDGIDLLEPFTSPRHNFDHCLLLNEKERLQITDLFDDLLHQTNSSNTANKTYRQIKLAQLLYMISQLRLKHQSDVKDVTKMPSWITHDVINFINDHIDEPLSLSTLSDKFYINRTYLCDKFKKDTGMTINQYMTNRRILMSRDLLNQDMSVTQVAMAVGYRDTSHFIRNFKKIVGTTPKQYAMHTL